MDPFRPSEDQGERDRDDERNEDERDDGQGDVGAEQQQVKVDDLGNVDNIFQILWPSTLLLVFKIGLAFGYLTWQFQSSEFYKMAHSYEPEFSSSGQ